MKFKIISKKLNFGGYAGFARKPYNLKELQKVNILFKSPYIIMDGFEVDEDQYDKMTSNFFNSNEWSGISEAWNDAYQHNQEYEIEIGNDFMFVIEITCPNRPTLLVDTEGFDYARYVAIKD